MTRAQYEKLKRELLSLPRASEKDISLCEAKLKELNMYFWQNYKGKLELRMSHTLSDGLPYLYSNCCLDETKNKFYQVHIEWIRKEKCYVFSFSDNNNWRLIYRTSYCEGISQYMKKCEDKYLKDYPKEAMNIPNDEEI